MIDATERIRAMLDERGVEWEECRVPTLRSELAATFWYDRDGNPCSAVEGADDVPDGMLSVQANLTPEQAIEATLGRGECRMEEGESMSEIAFGTPEHIAGLSREALEADFRYVQDRRTELEEVCERLQDENERLRSCLSDSAENAKQIMHEAHVQEAENAKLRELVRDMWEDACNAPCCAYCDHSDYNGDKCELKDRMSELGVEV